MLDKIINRIGVSLALILMICELTYVNAKSLLYLTADTSGWDSVMSVVGSLAFSMVTVVVMRKSESGWFKVVFPVFDAALVFLGFNLHHAGAILSGTDNAVRFYLTVFLAVFTGVITYSLGLINYRDHVGDPLVNKTDISNSATELMSEVDSLLGDFEKCQSENNSLRTHINSLEGDIASLQTEIEDKESDHKSLRHQLNDTQKQLVKYRGAYLKSEASRIRKKNEANRTPEENEILRLMETN